MTIPSLTRGTVFRAEHDDSFEFWTAGEPPRSKLCLVFNVTSPAGAEDVHYFLTTSKVSVYRENPSILSDTFIIPAGQYEFFPEETLIDFRTLCFAPLDKLKSKRLRVLGKISEADVLACAKVAGAARILENRSKRLLGLR
jgi:hypothetical protein